MQNDALLTWFTATASFNYKAMTLSVCLYVCTLHISRTVHLIYLADVFLGSISLNLEMNLN